MSRQFACVNTRSLLVGERYQLVPGRERVIPDQGSAKRLPMPLIAASVGHATAAPPRSVRSDSGASVQGVVLSRGDRLFDKSKIFVEQFLGLRAGRDWRSAIH
jgi:hypothetical protein